MASISTPESSLQDKPSRSEEIRDIDRAALAQKFSVTRRLFETKTMEVEGGGGQVSKTVTGRGNKGIADGNVEGGNGREGGNQVEKEEEESGKRKHAAVDGFHKDKSTNPPVINISSLSPTAQASPTRHLKFPVSDGPGEASNKSAYLDQHSETTGTQSEEERAESANLDLCLTPEEPVRAELVTIKNESSESDENEEEKGQKEDKNWLKDKGKKNVNSVEALVDDVFEEADMETTPDLYTLENRVEVRAGEVRPVASSEKHQELPTSMPCVRETKDDNESEREKYQQVNEQCEGKRKEQKKMFVGCDEKKSTEMWEENKEKKTEAEEEEGAGWKKGGVTQKEDADKEAEGKTNNEGGVKECRQSQEKKRTEKEKEREGEEGTTPERASEANHVVCRGGGDGAGGEEDKTESATICGIENKAFVYDQESQAHPEHSPRHDLESSLHTGSQLLLEYEEIPGVPDQGDEDASDLAKRKVKFSSAPIKVRKPLRK